MKSRALFLAKSEEERLKTLKKNDCILNNCLFWAIEQKVRYGGKVKAQKASRYFGSHFYWEATDGSSYERVPYNTHYLPWYKTLIILVHEGYIKEKKDRSNNKNA